MARQGWINVSVRCPFDRADDVCAIFERFGAEATTAQMPSKSKEPIAFITGLFEERWNRSEELRRELAKAGHNHALATFDRTSIADRDWVRESRANFKPVRIGNSLEIIAPWHTPAQNLASITINPSIAFGTGHHPTTRMCLEFIAEADLNGSTIVDYGCGSGVVALAAIGLGARFAQGVDIDSDALAESWRNAKRNGFEDRYRALTPEQLYIKSVKADIVVANLYSDLLCSLSSHLSSLVAESGWLAVSGILREQADAVCSAYCEDFDFRLRTQNKWALLSGRKRKFAKSL